MLQLNWKQRGRLVMFLFKLNVTNETKLRYVFLLYHKDRLTNTSKTVKTRGTQYTIYFK